MIINSDSLIALKEIEDNSIDAVITDPPYGYSFMGKDWDKAVPSVEIWKECLRVLKPGAWCMVMSAPRSDVQNAMISRLMEAGFRLDFTPIYWTYASGFPKAGNVRKLVDKRLGAEREVSGLNPNFRPDSGTVGYQGQSNFRQTKGMAVKRDLPATDEAKALDGSYTGFQPKPAVEVVIVAMKPLSEKTYIDQALKNGKGVTWLDDCRIPTDKLKAQTMPDLRDVGRKSKEIIGIDKLSFNQGITAKRLEYTPNTSGRFPANLLVSDQALNGHSKYFDLDTWADTLPFLAVPKASKSEKNKGLDGFEEKIRNDGRAEHLASGNMPHNRSNNAKKNHHPTVKPLKLMSYLITLTTREGDTVLDPFVGSGTTVVAANLLNRKGIGIEREEEYVEIARARVEANRPEPQLALEGEDVR